MRLRSSRTNDRSTRQAPAVVRENSEPLQRRRSLKLDEEPRVGEVADLDDRARRQLVLEELHPRRDDLLEPADVGRIDNDRYDVRKASARRFQDRLHVTNGLARLFGHVAGTDEIAIRVTRELAGQKDQRARVIDADEMI